MPRWLRRLVLHVLLSRFIATRRGERRLLRGLMRPW